MSMILVFSLLVLPLLNAAVDCTDLPSQEVCEKAGECVWDVAGVPTNCYKDPCYEWTVLTSSACSGTAPTGTTCERVQKVNAAGAPSGGPSNFCVKSDRLGQFNTQDKICSLQWGEYEYPTLASCKVLSSDAYGCGPVEKIQGTSTSYYVCKVEPPPVNPCTLITDQTLCTYVGNCLYGGDGCITDPCWEKTYVSSDTCKTIDGVACVRKELNPGGSPLLGYCKTPDHDLHSPCNVGTATNAVTKLAVCTWTGVSNIPADCTKVATVNNYDNGTLYLCNPTEEEFTISAAIISKPLVAALLVLLLLGML